MQSNANRSYSNPPLRELNSSILTQKVPYNLNSTVEVTRIANNRPTKVFDTSFELNEKKISSNEADRPSLIHRISKLQQEVDHLNHENSELHSKLHFEKARSEEIQKKVSHSSKVKTLVDRNYQGDLKYEREENSRLKHILKTLENERNDLRSKVKELEGKTQLQSYEKQDIIGKLQQKLDLIAIVEGDNRVLVDKISLLQGKISSYEKENQSLSLENEKFKSILMNIESQSQEIIARLQDECSRYNNLIIAKNDEFENLRWAFKRQLKIMSCTTMKIEFSKLINSRVHSGFYDMKINHEVLGKKHWALRKVVSIFSLFSLKNVRKAFNAMSSEMSWVSSSKLVENFVRKNAQNGKMMKIVRAWKKITEKSLIDNRKKLGCGKKIVKIFRGFIENTVEKRFRNWVKNSGFYSVREKCLRKIVMGRRKETLDLRFAFWKRFASERKMRQCIEDLSVDFAGKFVLQKFFSAFREYVKIKRQSRDYMGKKENQALKMYKMTVLHEFQRAAIEQKRKNFVLSKVLQRIRGKEKNRALQKWKEEVSGIRYAGKMERVMGLYGEKDKRKFLSVVFLAWKSYFMNTKFTKAHQSLLIERPQRENLEKSLASLSHTYHTFQQKHSLKLLTNPMYKKLNLSFTHWKKIKNHFKNSLQSVKNMLFKHYFLKLYVSFSSWRQEKSAFDYAALTYKNEQNLREKISISQNLLMISSTLQEKCQNIEQIKKNRVKKCLVFIIHRDLVNALRKWSNKSYVFGCKKEGSLRILSIFRKLLYKKAFVSIAEYAKNKRQKVVNNRVLRKFLLLQNQGSLEGIFHAWKGFSKSMKNFRKICVLSHARKNLGNQLLAVSAWKNYINESKIRQLRENSQKILQEKSRLESHILSLSQKIDLSSIANQRLNNILMEKGQKRLILAFFKGNENILKTCWKKWNLSLEKYKNVNKKTCKIISGWANKEKRACWKKWTVHVRQMGDKSSRMRLEKKKNEHQLLRSQMKKTQTDMQKEIELQKGKIVEMNVLLVKNTKFSEFLLSKKAREAENDFSVPKTAFFFNAMKSRFYHIKNNIYSMAKNIKKINIRRGLRDIKSYCLENLKVSGLRSMLLGTFKRYSQRALRNNFDLWYRNIWLCHDIRLKKTIKEEKMANQTLLAHEKLVKNKNREKIVRLLTDKNKQALFSAWRIMSKKLKALRVSNIRFSKVSRQQKALFALKHIKLNADYNRQSKLKTVKALALSQENLLKLHFSLWKRTYTRAKTIQRALGKTMTFSIKLSLSFSFEAIKRQSLLNSASSSFISTCKASLLKKTIISEGTRYLKKCLEKWKNSCRYQKSSQKTVKKAILRALHRKLRSGFDLWNEDILLKDTVDITNTQGPVAIENGILKSRIEILYKLINVEGLDKKFIEKYILEKENQSSALALQSLQLQKYKTGLINPKDCAYIPRYYLIWKQWVIKRKKISKVAYRMLAYLRKGDLMKGFLKWKHGLKLIVNTVNKLPRKELFALIAKMDMDVKFLETKLQDTHKKAVYFETYIGLMNTQVRRGQNMALTVCGLQNQKTLFQVMYRWSFYTGLCRVQDLLEQLTHAEQTLFIVKTALKSLEDENQILAEENMELRQASLDGVAIAEAFETLSKEREKLSLDLADRTATIKKLIDQNNELAEKLRCCSYDESPQKEVSKSKRYN